MVKMGRANHILIKFKERFGIKKSVEIEKASSAVEDITAIMNYINSFAFISGIEFVNDWKLNFRLFITAINILLRVFVEFYTIHYLFPDTRVFVMVGAAAYTATNYTKYGTIAVHHKKFMSLLNVILNVYNVNVSGVREQILKETCKTITKHCRYVFLGIVFGIGLYFFYPCYDLIANGNLTPISPAKFLFVDDTIVSGYCLSTFLNILFVAPNICGTFALSCVFFTYVDVYGGMVSLVEDDFKMFHRLWEEQGKGQQIAHKRKVVFRNILIELMDLARYNEYMNELFSFITTVQMGACYAGIVFVLFGYLADNFVSGIGAGIYLFTELMLLCYIGQLMENSSQRLEMIIYSSQWYRYDNNYQKDILSTLPIFQNVQPILVGNIYPLNFQTGLEVVKSIYSILMFLVNVLD